MFAKTYREFVGRSAFGCLYAKYFIVVKLVRGYFGFYLFGNVAKIKSQSGVSTMAHRRKVILSLPQFGKRNVRMAIRPQ
ncbi:MAG: hypothetical protein A2402_02285 [Candidatus Staskawiczbacteria bacterium RIFOXYC1_FULL_37_43]|nr:MAG: hypothetical protein A2813_01985 [Candidatus Staskawiczbacteria bacterium RIFCSPHIGHO2_01_FULL_37_17]OGZ71226.1 MAG: hypothetical protein A2891_03110 [Candidatus Staskawiczbacteria bacterium RIFCSPLOWO2_01_FULL_37_19]OGZ75634.1 MAG: hypothetical protein A2205_00365 [Candidatus Staskawiczbacteria bacterium RIFOXYA1_FULL_37_15]OGZ76658.1 MAG: hypothetical protein A2280_00455 [Candidatus Staskawiczbacteria bacterium RIFOXYA12_FULL_37_10]OGZ79910.1 MAG: hypothetical protein A2353_01605 [Can